MFRGDRSCHRQTDIFMDNQYAEWQVESLLASSKARLKTSCPQIWQIFFASPEILETWTQKSWRMPNHTNLWQLSLATSVWHCRQSCETYNRTEITEKVMMTCTSDNNPMPFWQWENLCRDFFSAALLNAIFHASFQQCDSDWKRYFLHLVAAVLLQIKT